MTINGEARDLPEGTTVEMLLERLGARAPGVAVAANARVVRRSDYAQTVLRDGDNVEIIKAVAGG